MVRGEIWWATLPDPVGAMPGHRRPVLIVQADSFNRSLIQTIIVVALTSNLRLVAAPGNVLLTTKATGLDRDSVVNVSQILSVDRTMLTELITQLSDGQMEAVGRGLRQVLDL